MLPPKLECGKCFYIKMEPTETDPRIYHLISDPHCKKHNVWFKEIDGVWVEIYNKKKLR